MPRISSTHFGKLTLCYDARGVGAADNRATTCTRVFPIGQGLSEGALWLEGKQRDVPRARHLNKAALYQGLIVALLVTHHTVENHCFQIWQKDTFTPWPITADNVSTLTSIPLRCVTILLLLMN